MKKVFALLLALAMLLSLTACTAQKEDALTVDEYLSQQSDATDKPTGEPVEPTDEPVVDALANSYTGNGYSLAIPDDFVEYDTGDDAQQLLAPSNYPTDSSNITIVTAEKDSVFSLYNEAILKAAFEEAFQQQLPDMTITVETKSFDRTTIDGHEAVIYAYSLSLNDVDMVQTVVMINADSLFTITYTQAIGVDYQSAFDASIASIKIG